VQSVTGDSYVVDLQSAFVPTVFVGHRIFASGTPKLQLESSRVGATGDDACDRAVYSLIALGANISHSSSDWSSRCNHRAGAKNNRERKSLSGISVTRCQAFPASLFFGAEIGSQVRSAPSEHFAQDSYRAIGFATCSNCGVLWKACRPHRVITEKLESAKPVDLYGLRKEQ
jgi:hypothetical protein